MLLEKQETAIILFDLQHKELCRHLVSSARGEKIINSDHRREKNAAIRDLEDQFCALVGEPQKARQFLAAIRQDKPRYIRDQILILIQVVNLSTPAIIKQALDFCCEQHIVGAADFKSIVAHYHYQLAEQPQQPSPAKLTRNPLNNQPPDPALIQPATSSIEDYNLF